jgi:predicted GIY-YIG superfamily endonuclease
VGSNPTPAIHPPRWDRGFNSRTRCSMRVEKDYRVYVIQNALRQFYIGLSDDPERRLEDHNAGISKWTKNKGPWMLVWTSEATSLSRARKLENLLKRQKGGDGFYQLTGLARSSGS